MGSVDDDDLFTPPPPKPVIQGFHPMKGEYKREKTRKWDYVDYDDDDYSDDE